MASQSDICVDGEFASSRSFLHDGIGRGASEEFFDHRTAQTGGKDFLHRERMQERFHLQFLRKGKDRMQFRRFSLSAAQECRESRAHVLFRIYDKAEDISTLGALPIPRQRLRQKHFSVRLEFFI